MREKSYKRIQYLDSGQSSESDLFKMVSRSWVIQTHSVIMPRHHHHVLWAPVLPAEPTKFLPTSDPLYMPFPLALKVFPALLIYWSFPHSQVLSFNVFGLAIFLQPLVLFTSLPLFILFTYSISFLEHLSQLWYMAVWTVVFIVSLAWLDYKL